MANEELTIAKEKARLTVIGNSYPDALTDSGLGFDLSQIIFDILIDLDIPMPDIDFDDLDDITIIPGLDIDTEIPTLEYPDPDWPDDEIPPIIDWPMPDLDWDDFIDKLEDLDLDIDILKDLSFVGLNDLELPTLVSLDMNFNIQMDELPASIEIVTPPNKLEYQDGERIDLTGMVVTAKKADGSTWTSAKYPNGHIPLGELIIEPAQADVGQSKSDEYTDGDGVIARAYTGSGAIGPWGEHDGRRDAGQIGSNGTHLYMHPGNLWLLTQYNGYIYEMGIPGEVGVWVPGSGGGAIGWTEPSFQEFTPRHGVTQSWDLIPTSTKDPKKSGKLKPEKSSQTITASWPRYCDGEQLVAFFDIEVKETPGGGGR